MTECVCVCVCMCVCVCVCVEQWWNCTDWGDQMNVEKNLFYTNWNGIEPRPPRLWTGKLPPGLWRSFRLYTILNNHWTELSDQRPRWKLKLRVSCPQFFTFLEINTENHFIRRYWNLMPSGKSSVDVLWIYGELTCFAVFHCSVLVVNQTGNEV